MLLVAFVVGFDELYNRHICGVSDARYELVDAGVSTAAFEEFLNLVGEEEVHGAFVADFREREAAEVELLGGIVRSGSLLGQSDYLFGKGTQRFGIAEGCLNSIVAEESR